MNEGELKQAELLLKVFKFQEGLFKTIVRSNDGIYVRQLEAISIGNFDIKSTEKVYEIVFGKEILRKSHFPSEMLLTANKIKGGMTW